MDGTSPGIMIDWKPWAGVACAPTTTTVAVDLAGLTGGAAYVPQNSIEWPPFNPSPTFIPIAPATVAPLLPQQHTHYHFAPIQPRLSDEDVERIVDRVIARLREAKP